MEGIKARSLEDQVISSCVPVICFELPSHDNDQSSFVPSTGTVSTRYLGTEML
jgi:hypothetical protein